MTEPSETEPELSPPTDTPPAGAADEPTAPAPTVATPAEPPSNPPGPPARSGVFVPQWLLVAGAALILLALGFVAGRVVSDHDHGRRGEVSFDDRARPPFMGGRGPQLAPDGGNRAGGSSNGGVPSGRTPNPNGGRMSPSAAVYLGAVVRDSSDPAGAALTQVVSASPAADAGLKSGDVVTKVDTAAVADAAQLIREIRTHQAGDTVTITYVRDGSTKTVDVRLATRPAVDQPLPQTSRQ